MEDWKRQNPVEWDAPTEEAWAVMLEVEPLEAEADPKDPGAVIMLIDLQKGVRKSTADSSMEQGMWFKFPVQLSRLPCWYFPHHRRVGWLLKVVLQRQCQLTQQYWLGEMSGLCC